MPVTACLTRPPDHESAMTEKPTKPARKRAISRKAKPAQPQPTHDEISMRAYFLHLEAPQSDELGNWLRAERELTPA
jgi:hypothetical protein